MRRKPVVVVGVAAVLVGVGVLAAGQAGAQETPPGPRVPGFSLGDRPELPAATDGPVVAKGSEVDDRSDLRGGAVVRDGVDLRTGTDRRERGGARPARRPAADQLRAARAAHVVQVRVKAEKPGVTIAQRPAAKPQAPGVRGDKPVPAQRDAGRSLVEQAKDDVTAADLSTSPGSPVQQQILALINQERQQHGCGRVTLDRRLIGAAHAQAADMARHGYFAHDSRDGKDPGYRVTRAGFVWRQYGENIARGAGSPYEVVDGWMHSPEHRKNILDCGLEQMGIGVAIAGDQNQTVYWVQDFATPM